MPVRYVGGFHTIRDREPEGINEDVALAALHALVPIESANSTAFRGLYRLAVHDHDRWTLGSARLRSHLLIDPSLHAGPHAAVLPRSEVVIYGAPGGEVLGKQAPLAAGSKPLCRAGFECFA